MKELNAGPLPVCDRDHIAGMLTDRDITVRAVAEGRDPRSTRVRDVMTRDVISCYEDQDVAEAVRLEDAFSPRPRHEARRSETHNRHPS